VYVCRRVGDAYRYTIQPIYDNLTESVNCHIRRRPSSPILFDLFYFVEVPARDFRSPVIRRQVLADAVNGADGGRRGSVVADYLSVDFDVGVNLADDFLLRATGLAEAQSIGGDRTVTGTAWNVDDDDEERRGPMRFRVHEIAQSAAFVASVRPRKPFGISTARWRRPSDGAADAGAASCDMCQSKFLSADNPDDNDHQDERDSDRRQFQAVKAVIQRRPARDHAFLYYIIAAGSAPLFRFKIRSKYKRCICDIIILYISFYEICICLRCDIMICLTTILRLNNLEGFIHTTENLVNLKVLISLPIAIQEIIISVCHCY